MIFPRKAAFLCSLMAFLTISQMSHFTKGDLESTFARCCALGANWARERQNCLRFPAPVPGELPEHQSICLTSASICCLRFYREAQCESAKQAAKSGLVCTTSPEPGGEFYKDCCDGCKLGLVSGSMAMECDFKGFSFGFPWNDAYLECCHYASPLTVSENVLSAGSTPKKQGGSAHPNLDSDDENFLFINRPDLKDVKIPDAENLCLLFPGQLCGHVCVPTPGSYVCQCRAGATLSVDGKTCIQDHIQDRCKINNPCDHICRDTGVSIVCSCNPGYQLSVDQRTCNDIDECLQGTHQCIPSDQVCYNQLGSYSCINSDGTLSTPRFSWGPGPTDRPDVPAQRNPNLGINNPTTGLGNQNSIEVTSPSKTLLLAQQANQGICPPGYSFNQQSRVCDDVDECSVAIGICGPGSSCQNNIGSYRCTSLITGNCPSGYKFDLNHQSCLDTDECALKTHSCGPSEVCVNILGSFECHKQESHSDCPAGYKYNSQIKICEDVDECSEGLHSCHPDEESCRNIIGAYECDMKCQDGFQSSADPPSCVDINECTSGFHGCNPTTEICLNTVGSYQCKVATSNEIRQIQLEPALHLPKVTTSAPLVQECPSGYGFDFSTSQCLDINECASELHNCIPSLHQCINTLGSFLCRPKSRCSSGYKLNAATQQCEDIDECSDGTSNCLLGQICVNTKGSFDCQVECRDGFLYDALDPAICADINECLSNPCNNDQSCTNTEGSYICLSELKPTTQRTTIPPTTIKTTPTPRKVSPTKAPCPPGFRRKRKNLECKDINECREGLHHCLKLTEECVNLPGNYTCKPKPCSRGFFRNFNNNECEDIDECSNLPCNFDEECINTPGSFLCRVRPPCEDGFRRNERSKDCEDIDECVEEAPCDTSTRCINTKGSYRCRSLDCTPGYQRNSVSGKCEDVDECETGEHNCRKPAEECINSPGTYRCKALPPCPGGFKRDPSTFRCVDVDECAEGLADCREGEACINQYGRYKCKKNATTECQPGFQFHESSKRCQDIDECFEGSDTCDSEEQTCINSAGSFRCVDRQLACDFGFRFDNEQKNCKDIDECEERTHLCSSTRENCVNFPGGYSCERKESTTTPRPPPIAIITTNTTTTSTTTTTVPITATSSPKNIVHPPLPQCPDGYIYNALYRSCVDIDECDDDVCDKEEFCINTLGGYECDCKVGFAMNDKVEKCADINECQLGLHTCQNLQRCDNTIGSYTCTRISGCGTGYTLNHNTGLCEDDDECTLGKDDCRQLGPKWVCVNTKGSFRCEKKKCPPKQLLNSWGICVNISCTPGFKPLDKHCVDVDECTEGKSPCKVNELCYNLIGTYECRPRINCGRGYRMNVEGTQCIDIDECDENVHSCDGGQLCTNRPGGYICQCPPGYRLDINRQCQDINECQTAYSSLCGNTGECENTPGSYRCHCKPGFKKSSEGATCKDIDECIEIEGICQHNCINIWGSHYCTCNAGFKLESDNRTCSDVDECEEIRGRGRLCLGVCVNTPGSFKCTCPSGYKLDLDQRTCKDINECDNIETCRDVEEICVNIRGGHRCQRINCPPNYVKDTTHRNRCKKEKLCGEEDTACLQQPLTYSYNFLPLASNMTLRPLGEVDLFTMRGPLWSSTNVQFSLELEFAKAQSGITPAARDYFLLNRTAFNQVVLTLIKSLEGPQEVLLNLNMKLYHNGQYEGSAVAKLLIFVSQYDF